MLALNRICASFDGKQLYPGFEVQLCGFLLKRVNKNANKWKKKFCVIRDGFFFLFREETFIQNNTRGSGIPISQLEAIVPLSKANVEENGDNENPYCFSITSGEHPESLSFSTNHADILLRWMQCFREAKSISYEHLNDVSSLSIIRDEKSELYKENLRLQDACRLLSNQNDELLRLNDALDCERLHLSQKLLDLEEEMDSTMRMHEMMQTDQKERLQESWRYADSPDSGGLLLRHDLTKIQEELDEEKSPETPEESGSNEKLREDSTSPNCYPMEELEHLQKQMKHLMEELREKDVECEAMVKEIHQLKVNQTTKSSVDELNKQLKEKDSKNQFLTKQILQLEQKLNEKPVTPPPTVTPTEETSVALSLAKTKTMEMEHLLEEQQRECQLMTEKIKELERKLNEKSMSQISRTTITTATAAKVEDLVKRLREKDSECQSLTQQIQQLKKQLNEKPSPTLPTTTTTTAPTSAPAKDNSSQATSPVNNPSQGEHRQEVTISPEGHIIERKRIPEVSQLRKFFENQSNKT